MGLRQFFAFSLAGSGFPLARDPHSQQKAVLGAVGAGNIQISMFIKIRLCLSVVQLPFGFRSVPDHADFLQFRGPFRRELSILFPLALVGNPLTQIKSTDHAAVRHQQVSVGLIVFLGQFVGIVPEGIQQIPPDHTDGVQGFHSLFGQLPLAGSAVYRPLGLNPHPQLQPGFGHIPLGHLQVAVF